MKGFFIKLSIVILLLMTLSLGIGVGIYSHFTSQLPQIESLADYSPSIPSKIFSKDGRLLAEIGREKREVIEISSLPQVVIDSFLAAEDDSFYEHRGVDYTGLMRAFWVNLKAGRVVQGGSTITQQVAKSLLLTRERSLSRKIKDFLLAQKIEERFTKEEILFLYLNQVYLGSSFYGVKAALNGYFGKDLDEITIAEASMVAGLLVAPSKYSPMSNPEAAFKRQRYVLKRLLLTRKITEDEYKEALEEKIKFKIRKKNIFSAGYFTDWVRQDFIEKYGEEELLTNGYIINTTLDYELQQVAEKSILDGVREVDRRQGYKGNIGNISTEEQAILDFDIRKKVYRKYSTFFTLNKDFEREYEVELNEEDYHNQVLFYNSVQDSFTIGNWSRGYNQEDQFLNYLHKGDSFKAVVQSVNDKARLIFVTLGGVSGFISYDNFKWAHERVIEADRKYFPFVTKPSSIVKEGDIVKVRISNVKDSVWDKINSSYKKTIKNKDLIEKIKFQTYLNLELDQEVDVQAAIVSIDPFTGDVITLVGGTNFEKSQFNRALQSLRQPGSSFKPFIYAAGLEHGYTPSTVIMDSPESLTGAAGGPNWKPRNYDGKYLGPITFRTSLEKSRNIPTIKIAENVGVSNIVDFVDRLGMIVKLEKDLGLSLGSFGITLLDLVESYGVFPNGGKQVKSRSIVSIIDRNGEDIWHKGLINQVGEEVSDSELFGESDLVENANDVVSEEDTDINPFYKNLDDKQVFDSRLSYIMTNLLRGVIQNGTGRAAKKIGTYLGGKTGTTSNYVDAWFLGFSSKIVSGVWVGFDNNKTLGWGETGSKSALPIWSQVMDASLKKYGESDFDVPDGILNIGIDRKTGKIAKTHSSHPFIESFVDGYGPESIPGELNNSSSVIYEEDEYFDEQ